MMKKLGLTTVVLSVLLLSGCGGSGSKSKDPMNSKKYIFILTEVASGICENEVYRNSLKEDGLLGLLTRETENDTSCQTYNKKNDNKECAIQLLGGGNKNCVTGFDNIPEGYDGLAKQVGTTNLTDITELISSSF